MNVDGGDVTQMTYRMGDGRAMLIPPRWAVAGERMLLAPDFGNAPKGGTLTYFYVRE